MWGLRCGKLPLPGPVRPPARSGCWRRRHFLHQRGILLRGLVHLGNGFGNLVHALALFLAGCCDGAHQAETLWMDLTTSVIVVPALPTSRLPWFTCSTLVVMSVLISLAAEVLN